MIHHWCTDKPPSISCIGATNQQIQQTPRERQVTPAGFTFNSQRAICSFRLMAADARTATVVGKMTSHQWKHLQNGETLGNTWFRFLPQRSLYIHTYIYIYKWKSMLKKNMFRYSWSIKTLHLFQPHHQFCFNTPLYGTSPVPPRQSCHAGPATPRPGTCAIQWMPSPRTHGWVKNILKNDTIDGVFNTRTRIY